MTGKIEKTEKMLIFIMVGLCILSSVSKVCIGIDYDEACLIASHTRILDGERFLKEMWGIGQFSCFPGCFFIWIYRTILGSTEGMYVYLRVVTTIIQAAISLFFYYTFRKDYKHVWIPTVAIFVMLPRATQNFEYGMQTILLLILSVCILYKVNMEKDKRSHKWISFRIVVAATLYAWAILSYPGIIFTVPFMILAIWNVFPSENRLVIEFVFWGTCIVLAVLLFLVVLSYLSPDELFDNILWMTKEGSHSTRGRFVLVIKELFFGKNLVFSLATLVLGFVYKLFVEKHWRKTSIVNGAMLGTSIVILGLNITGLRLSGPFGFLIRLLVISILGWNIVKKDKMIFWLFYVFGLSVMLGPAVGSNLGIGENSGFVELAIIAIILVLAQQYEDAFARIPVLIFVCSLIFYKGVLVRNNSTGPANIFEERVCIKDGPYKKIYMYPEEAEDYNKKCEDLKRHLKRLDTVVYLGDNSVYQTIHEGRFSSPTGTDTPIFDEQWVTYYRDRDYVSPDVYILDKEKMSGLDKFVQTSFGQYLDKQGISVIDETDSFIYFTSG